MKGDFSYSTDRLIEEPTVIHKLKTDTHGLTQDMDFLTHTFSCDTPLPPPTLLMFDLRVRTVVILSSFNDVTLLTSVDIVPPMKTAGMVKKFWTLYIFYWINVSMNLCFSVSLIDLYIYINMYVCIYDVLFLGGFMKALVEFCMVCISR